VTRRKTLSRRGLSSFLSTIHSAKGQEWKVVYILNVADGWIPSDMAVGDEEQIEEERAPTLCGNDAGKRHLHLSYPSRFYTYGFKHRRADRNMFSTRSRFIPKQFLTFFKRDTFRKTSVTMERKPGMQGPTWRKNHRLVGLIRIFIAP